MALKRRAIPSSKLFLGVSPSKLKDGIPTFDRTSEHKAELLHSYLITNVCNFWEAGKDIPDYAFAKYLGVHRAVWDIWRRVLTDMKLFTLSRVLETGISRHLLPIPGVSSSETQTWPLRLYNITSFDELEIEPSMVTLEGVTDFDPYNVEHREANKKLLSPFFSAVEYVDKYYMTRLDEVLLVEGRHRKHKDGYFAPATVPSIYAYDHRKLRNETPDRKREVVAACRVPDLETKSNRVRPVILPGYRGDTPRYIQEYIDGLKNKTKAGLKIRKRPGT